MTETGRVPLPMAHNVLDETMARGNCLVWDSDDILVEDSASPSSSHHPIGLIAIAPIDWDMLKSRVCRLVSV